MQTGSTQARDGAHIGWEVVGAGPGIVVVHGGGRAGKHYRALAAALAGRFSVFLLDRRGRGLTSPAPAIDGIDVEVSDLEAVLAATGARFVFGHSAGAVIALEAALRIPIAALALYEPPINGSIPVDWVVPFEAALAADRPARAFVELARGLEMGPPAWMPGFALESIAGLMMRFTQDGREMPALVRTVSRDIAMAQALPIGAERFRALSCRTLLLSGGSSPPYLRDIAGTLTSTIPGARHVELSDVAHNAPDMEAPARVAAELAAFFGA